MTLSAFLARDAFVRTNHSAIAMLCVRQSALSVCPSGTSVHCDHTVHVSADLSFSVHDSRLQLRRKLSVDLVI